MLRLPPPSRFDSVPRMSEGRANRTEGQSKCQRPQGFWGFHFGPTFRFHLIPPVPQLSVRARVPVHHHDPSPAPPGPYYFRHISRLQKFFFPRSLISPTSERVCHAVRHLGTITVREVPPFSLDSAPSNVTYCNLFFPDAPFSCIHAPV